MLKVIGGAQEGEFKAVASGTLPNGKAVVVNSDGTVSIITGATGSTGTNTEIAGQAVYDSAAVYDTTNDKVVVMYRRDVGGVGYYKVGTVSGTTITFGAEGTFNGGGTAEFISACYDSTNDRVVVVFEASGGVTSSRVGAVSGTTVTWGSAVTVAASAGSPSISYDAGQDAVVVAYQRDSDLYGMLVIGETITSGGGYVNWGTPVVINSADTFSDKSNQTVVYDSNAQKTVVAYRDKGNSQLATARVCTVNGTSLTVSLGAEATATNGAKEVSLAFDSVSNKVVLTSVDNVTDLGYVAIGTVSGTSISFGTPVDYSGPSGSTGVSKPRICFDSNAGKILISYKQQSGAQSTFYRTGKVSGTSVTIDDAVQIDSGAQSGTPFPVYDPDQTTILINFANTAISDEFYSLPLQLSFTNLTTENYIGMSRGVTEIVPSETGTAATYDSSETAYQGATFDSGNNKVVIGYRDYGNSSYGTAVVGTVSGTSITYGTPVVFETGTTNYVKAAYDSNAGKVVFVYQDQSNSAYATAVVGTVSGTSISFGTPVVFESSSTEFFGITFDSSNNKIVVAMRDNSGPPGDEQRGRAIVGTVSGTSISFGTAVTFLADSANAISIAYDTTAEKVVIAYQDSGDGNKGKAVVGTVSGTSISFGTAGIFESTSFGTASGTTYDPVNNKIVIAYRETTTGEGRAVVGTVSGTSITFGTPSSFMTGIPVDITSAYDTETGAVVITYKDNADAYTYAVAATVSGTSVSFSNTLTVENSGTTAYTASTYDTNANKSIATYKYDFGSTGVGKAIVFKVGLENRFPIADGAAASIDLIGAISTNQGGLTAGEKYYVQTDGTISTTAGSPSVLAGTAISATKLVVKT